MGRRGPVGLFVNRFTTVPRVEGSKLGSSLSFSSCKKNVSLQSEPTRRERGAAQERQEEEEEPAGKSGMDTRKDF